MQTPSLTTLTTLFALLTLSTAQSTTTTAEPIANTPIPTARSACPTSLHAIAISGQGSADVGGYGKLQTLVNNVTSIIPGSTQVSLTYPKADPNINEKIDTGASNLMNYLQQYTTACPTTKIAILSYSSGSMIAMNGVCGAFVPFSVPATGLATLSTQSSNATAKALTRNIVAVTAYGDETYAASEPFTVGSCTGTGGQGEVARTNAASCNAWKGMIQSYCVVADPRCCGGSDPNAHFVYPNLYDVQAANYVKGKWMSSKKRKSARGKAA